MMNNTLVQFVFVIFITVLLLLSNPATADTGFGDDLTAILKTKLTFTNNKKQKLTVGKITLMNKSNKKTGQTIYSGLTLVVTNVSDIHVSLINPSGFTKDGFPFLLIPNTTPLKPQKALKSIQLQFNNPEAKKFKFSFSIYGSMTAVKINNTSPAVATSGAEITLTGQHFTRASLVELAGQKFEPRFISDQQLQVVVPFKSNTKHQLVPLKAGNYQIKVDSSSAYKFTVIDLPKNTNPPGQLLNDHINSTFEELNKIVPVFQAILPQLMMETAKEPNTQSYIQGLADLADYLNTQVQPSILQQAAKIKPTTLDTLERVLKANQTISENSTTSNTPIANSYPKTSSSNLLEGDQWLKDRVAYATGIQKLKLLSDMGEWCGYVLSTVNFNPEVAAICLAQKVAGSVSQILWEIEATKKYGAVKRIQLHISNFTGNPNKKDCTDEDNPSNIVDEILLDSKVKRTDSVCLEGLLIDHEQVNLHLNNVNNNEINPTDQAKNISGATLYVTQNIDLAQISNIIINSIAKISNVKISNNFVTAAITKKLLKLLAIKADDSTNQTLDTKEISASGISSKLGSFKTPTWWSGNTSLINWFPGNCDIQADSKHFYLKTNSTNNFVVPDVFPAHAKGEMPGAGSCDYKILDIYRMPSEDSVYSQIHFHIKNYPLLNLTIEGKGSVVYGTEALPFKTFSGSTKCKNDHMQQVVCKEYFDPGDNWNLFWLIANTINTNGSDVAWQRNEKEICKGELRCLVQMNSFLGGQHLPLDVKVTNNNPDLSDYRFEFGDANYSAGPKCQNYSGKNAFGRLTASSWVNADFDFCYQLVKPIINCVGEGCLESRFSFIVFKIVHSYINQVVLSGNGSSITNGCYEDETSDFLTQGFSETYPGHGWDTLKTKTANLLWDNYAPPYQNAIYAPYKKNITNLTVDPSAGPGGPYGTICITTGYKWQISGAIYDTIYKTYEPFSTLLSIP